MRYYRHIIRNFILAAVCAMGLAACAMDPTLSYNLGKQNYGEQNYHTAFTYLLESAKFRNANAQYAVGYMYYYGVGTQQSLPLAIKWFQAAADQGHYKAMMALRLAKSQVPDMIFDNGHKYAATVAKKTQAERLIAPARHRHHPFVHAHKHAHKVHAHKHVKLAKIAPPAATHPAKTKAKSKKITKLPQPGRK